MKQFIIPYFIFYLGQNAGPVSCQRDGLFINSGPSGSGLPPWVTQGFNDDIIINDLDTRPFCSQPFCNCDQAGFLRDPRIYIDPASGCPTCECELCPQPEKCNRRSSRGSTFGTEIFTNPRTLCPESRCIRCPSYSCECPRELTEVEIHDSRGCPICTCVPLKREDDNLQCFSICRTLNEN